MINAISCQCRLMLHHCLMHVSKSILNGFKVGKYCLINENLISFNIRIDQKILMESAKPRYFYVLYVLIAPDKFDTKWYPLFVIRRHVTYSVYTYENVIHWNQNKLISSFNRMIMKIAQTVVSAIKVSLRTL